MKKLMTWTMTGIILIGLFIIQSSNVMADQQAAETSTGSVNKAESYSNSKKSSSEKNSSELQSSSNRNLSSENSKSVLTSSNSAGDLPSVESIKASNELEKPSKLMSRAEAIDDGISNWKTIEQGDIQGFKMDDLGKSINYNFANMDGSRKEILPGGAYGSELSPRMTVFIKDTAHTPQEINSVYFQNVGSSTTYDFGVTFDKHSEAGTAKDTSFERHFTSYETFEADITDPDTGRSFPAIKTVGEVDMDGKHFMVEELLRPSLEKPVIQQELYVVNLDDTAIDAGVFFGKDSNVDGADWVSVFAQQDNNGMYLQSDNYKMFMNTNVTDGPVHYTAGPYSMAGSGDYNEVNYGLKYYDSSDFDSSGAEVKNLKEGAVVYDSGDSTYSNKWGWESFKKGEVKHFRTDIGLVGLGVVVPDAAISYKNDTTADGKNHVKDDLVVDLKTHNLGYYSVWDGITVTSNVPKELDIDSESLEYIDPNGDITPIDASNYHEDEGRKIQYKIPPHNDDKGTPVTGLKDNEWGTIRYKATVNHLASASKIKHKMISQGGISVFNKASDEIEIPVELENVSVEKTVRNETDKETEYKDKTIGHPSDILEYKIQVAVDENGENVNKVDLTDSLPKGLTLVSGSVKLTYNDGTEETPTDVKTIILKKMLPKDTATITFQTKVANDETLIGKTLKNDVIAIPQLAITGDVYTHDEADVKIEKPKDGDVVFRYIDRKTGKKIAKDIKIHGPSGEHVSKFKTPAADADKWIMSELQADGSTWLDSTQDASKVRPAYIDNYTPIDYIVGDDLTGAPEKIADVDPIIQSGDPAIYTFRYEKTRLELTSLPSKMNFGKFYDTQADRTFYLPATDVQPRDGNHYKKSPYSIEVTDYWGIKGWTLNVQQDQQFHFTRQLADGKTETVNLDGAQLQFHNAKLTTETKDKDSVSNEKDAVTTAENFDINPGATPQTLIDYQRKGQYLGKDSDNTKNLTYDSPGYSIHKYQFGDEKSADYSIGLHVPGTTKRYARTYSTTLLWNLTVAP